ncbi:MAG: molybdopterin-dependent oxidoreductase [Thermoleophilia bacterium]|jgi:DMSO/TMAO reductase YedYZ molybdopterin-dependent catalytic subunit
MRSRVRPFTFLGLLLLVIVMMAFAVACGDSTETDTTAAETETTVAVETPTTAVETPATAVETPATAVETPATAVETPATAVETPATADTTAAAADGTMTVKGLVDNPLTLTADDLQKMTTATIKADHPKKGSQEYTGVRMSTIMSEAKVQSGATVVILGCTDGYMAEIALSDIKATADSMIAVGDDGTMNAVMPGMTGKAWASDIVSMEFK